MKRKFWVFGISVTVLVPLFAVHSQSLNPVNPDTIQQVLTGGNQNALNAQCIEVRVPSVIKTGVPFTAVAILKNTSNVDWTAAGGFKLGSQNPQDNTTWGNNRVDLPRSVVRKRIPVQFNFTVTPPPIAGSYPFSWQMLQEGNKWFGDICSTETPIQVIQSPNSARGIAVDVPNNIIAGQQFSATVTMQNTGKGTWLASDNNPYGIQSRVPPDNLRWGVKRALLETDTRPGENAVFHINVTAPATFGPYYFAWRMVQGDGNFGSSVIKRVTVKSVATSSSTPTPTVTPTPLITPSPTPTPLAVIGDVFTALRCVVPDGTVTPSNNQFKAVLSAVPGSVLDNEEIEWSVEPLEVSPLKSVTDSTGTATTNFILPFDAGVEGPGIFRAWFKEKNIPGNPSLHFFASSCEAPFNYNSPGLPIPSPTQTPEITPTITPNPNTPAPNPNLVPLSATLSLPAVNSQFSIHQQIPVAVYGSGHLTCGSWSLTKPNGQTIILTASDFVGEQLPNGQQGFLNPCP